MQHVSTMIAARKPPGKSRLFPRLLAVVVALGATSACGSLTSGTLTGNDLESGAARLVVQTRHEGAVYALAYGNEGRLLATAGLDRSVRVWDGQTGAAIRVFEGHSGAVVAVDVSESGGIVASGGRDRAVRIWDVGTGELVHEIASHSDPVLCLAISPDGQKVATGDKTGHVLIHDLEDGSKIAELGTPTSPIDAVAWSPNGSSLAVGRADGTISILLASGEQGRDIGQHDGSVEDLAFFAQGEKIASGGSDSVVRIWSASSGDKIRELVEDSPVAALAVSRDEKSIAVGRLDNAISVWSLESGDRIGDLRGKGRRATSIAYGGENGEILAAAYDDGPVTLWDVASETELVKLEGGSLSPTTTVALDKGNTVLAIGALNNIHVFDLASGELTQTLRGHKKPVRSVAFRPSDKNTLASASEDGTVRVWDLATGKAKTLRGHEETVTAVAWQPNGAWLASASEDRTIRLWDGETGDEIHTLEGHGFWVNALVWHPNGERLFSASDDSTIRVWNVVTAESLRTLTGHASDVEALALSPSGKLLASGGRDGTIRMWDLEGNEKGQLYGHEGPVSVLGFTDEGHIATAGSDGLLVVWPINDPEAEPPEHALRADSAHALVVQADEKYMITVGTDGIVRGWSLTCEPRWSLFAIDSRDWVVSTEEGYFDGSDAGRERTNYVQGAEPIPLSALREVFYAPGVLTALGRGDSPEATPGAPVLKDGLPRPPTLKFTKPEQPGKKGKWVAETTVAVEARDTGAGVKEVRLYHNGVRIDDGKQSPIAGGVVRELTTKLVRGRNHFEATAINDNQVLSPPASTLVLGKAKKRKANLYVLAVADPAVSWGAKAVRGVVDRLSANKRKLYGTVEANTVTENPTPGAVGGAARALSAKMEMGDVAVVYLAAIASGNAELRVGGLDAPQLESWIAAMPARQRLVVLDLVLEDGADSTIARRGAAALATRVGGDVLVVIGKTASKDKIPPRTKAILTALDGEADGLRRKDRRVSAAELRAFLEQTPATGGVRAAFGVSRSTADFYLTRR